MQLTQLLGLTSGSTARSTQQKAHDRNRQLMRFVTMSLVSYAGAAIIMIQAVDRLIGANR